MLSQTEETFRALIRVYGLLQRYMHPYFAASGISGAQWGVLHTLYRLEKSGEVPPRIGELSDRLLIQPPSVTGVIDRLERSGFVNRKTSKRDLRSKTITLTDKGRVAVEKFLEDHPERIAGALKGLKAQEQNQLRRLLEKLALHLGGN